MPHITVQMFPGRNDEIKKNLAEKLAKAASKELGRGIEHFSVSVEDVPQDEWKERIFDKIVDPDNKTVFVKPGYTM
ncbi:MAG: tautomerase family protein [Spirochaetales bacterium]|nr:tautomerase family protein [Spirochaetales bacterium]